MLYMQSVLKSVFYIVFLSFVLALFYSCAQVGSISGGDKDTIPPVLLYSEPPMADTGFTGNRIKITFDEYFVIEKINEEFIASPPLKEFPKIRWKKHTLIVDIKDTLKKPETYTLYFGNAIQDLNENNILENFKFIFSTGSVVDSFAISGRLRNAEDLKVPENTLVFAYREHSDSIPFLFRPDYLSKIDTLGNFSISNIQGGAYKIFAFQDLNGDLKLNPTEQRAFLDSIIIPQREIIVNIDSLKAGTILHDVNDTTYADTLQRDTVIITEQHFTYPNNIFLYLFPEIKHKQRLSGYEREKRGKVNFTFDIPLSDKYQMRPLNFSLTDGSYLLEMNPEKDSLLYWFRDTTIQNTDTLKFELTYQSIDSVNNPIMVTDTVLVEFREKKKDDAWKKDKNKDTTKAKPIEYLRFEYNLEQKKLDLQKNLSFEVSEPLFSVDTAKIELFEIIDTNTIDTKEQKILRAMRISEKDIFMQFRRPIVNKLQFSLLNQPRENWYRQIRRADSTSYYYQITDDELANTDTLALIVDFDNDFFLEQIQELRDTIQLGIQAQRLKYKSRKKPDLMELGFYKPLRNKIEVFALDYPQKTNAFRLQQNILKDSLRIYIRDNELQLLDTIKLSLKSLDYINLSGDSIFYTDTVTMVYHEKQQFLSFVERPKPDLIKMIFNKSVFGNIELEPLNFPKEKWSSIKFNTSKDTVEVNITNKNISTKDSLEFVVRYRDKNRHETLTKYADTILLINEKPVEIKEKETEKVQKTEQKPQIVHVYYPLEYKFWRDSSQLRIYHISTNWKEDTKYRITVDSMAFSGFLRHYNQYTEQDFSTQKEDYYALLNVNIKNIQPDFTSPPADTLSSDSTAVDSVAKAKPIVYSAFLKERLAKVIGEGQIIVQLIKTDKEGNEEVFRSYYLKDDKALKIDYINPGSYLIRVIFDRNSNNRWDTGNYLKHIHPEKVIYFPKKFEMKEGWEMNLDWDIGSALINSLDRGD